MCILGYFATENNDFKSIEAIELSKIPRDIWARVALSEIIPRTDFRQGDVGHQSVDLTQDTGHVGYYIYIYTLFTKPHIYICEWSDRYGYILYIFASRATAGDYR